MKIQTTTIFFTWLIGMMVSFGNVQGIIAVTSMAFILIWIRFFDDEILPKKNDRLKNNN